MINGPTEPITVNMARRLCVCACACECVAKGKMHGHSVPIIVNKRELQEVATTGKVLLDYTHTRE